MIQHYFFLTCVVLPSVLQVTPSPVLVLFVRAFIAEMNVTTAWSGAHMGRCRLPGSSMARVKRLHRWRVMSFNTSSIPVGSSLYYRMVYWSISLSGILCGPYRSIATTFNTMTRLHEMYHSLAPCSQPFPVGTYVYFLASLELHNQMEK